MPELTLVAEAKALDARLAAFQGNVSGRQAQLSGDQAELSELRSLVGQLIGKLESRPAAEPEGRFVPMASIGAERLAKETGEPVKRTMRRLQRLRFRMKEKGLEEAFRKVGRVVYVDIDLLKDLSK